MERNPFAVMTQMYSHFSKLGYTYDRKCRIQYFRGYRAWANETFVLKNFAKPVRRTKDMQRTSSDHESDQLEFETNSENLSESEEAGDGQAQGENNELHRKFFVHTNDSGETVYQTPIPISKTDLRIRCIA
jgi:hypothetical protein